MRFRNIYNCQFNNDNNNNNNNNKYIKKINLDLTVVIQKYIAITVKLYR